MGNTDPVIVDAAWRFAERQKTAQEQARYLELSDELRMVGDCIAEQPSRFFAYLQSCSQTAADRLRPDFGENMKAKMVLEDSDIPERWITSGVYYRENGSGDTEPTLLVSDRDVATMGLLLEPLAGLGDETSIKRRINTATSAICWMSLGIWAYEKLEHTVSGIEEHTADSLLFWEEVTDFPLHSSSERLPPPNTLLAQNSEVVKLRLAGSCAYYALQDAGLASEVELKSFQRLYCAPNFVAQIEERPHTIRPEHFALANPFSSEQVKQLFSQFGLKN